MQTLEDKRIYQAEKRQSARNSGLCGYCTYRQVRIGFKLCQVCYESKKQASKVVRKAGLCYRCQRRKASGPTKSCRVCRLRKLSDHMLVKTLTIWVYGGKCACKPCSEKDINFLTLDHIKGGGKQHRKVVNGSLFRWAWRNNFPKSLRLLCYNCNSAREHNGGVCPHVKVL